MSTPPEGALVGRASAVGQLAVAYLLYVAGYLAINRFNAGRPAATLFLPGEERLPLVAGFGPLYATGFLLPLLVIAFPLPRARFRQLLASFSLTAVVAFSVFLVFPVVLQRPAMPGGPGALLLRLAWLDLPGNCFPSLHVAVTWLFWLAYRDRVPRPGALLALVAGICASTVPVKQHYIVDIAAGIVLATASWSIGSFQGRAIQLPPASS